MKCVLILLDGLGDRSHESLGHQTPLQAARTPVLDGLAEKGANGLYHATTLGIALPSENAHFAMLGYDPEDFPGRGALEALGAGIALGPGDVAVLAHFAGLTKDNGNLVLENGSPPFSEQDAAALIRAVGEHEEQGIPIRFHQTRGLFGIITLRGRVSPFITDSDPVRAGRMLGTIKPWAAHAGDPDARNTAAALKGYLVWAYHTLQRHPVNGIRARRGQKPVNGLVTQRAGRLRDVTPFHERYGLRGLSLSSGILYKGLCSYLGIDYKNVKIDGDPDQDIAERLSVARRALEDYDFVHVHTKAPDVAAHTKNPTVKKKVIEALDHGIGKALGPLMKDPEVLIVVTSDHSTPSSGSLIHSGEAVPVLFCGQGVRRDRVREFNEVSAAHGALGCLRGREVLYMILNHLDRSKLAGLMDTPVDQPFWPGRYEPLRTA